MTQDELKAKVWASAGGVIDAQKCERAIAYIYRVSRRWRTSSPSRICYEAPDRLQKTSPQIREYFRRHNPSVAVVTVEVPSAGDVQCTSTGNLHATFLLNFFDEVRWRVPVGK